MDNNIPAHNSVMMNEVLEILNPKSEGFSSLKSSFIVLIVEIFYISINMQKILGSHVE